MPVKQDKSVLTFNASANSYKNNSSPKRLDIYSQTIQV